MRIGGFLPTTLLDYPGHLACTVFTQGCNLRCPFCQNGSLVLPEHFDAPLSEEDILTKIKKRSGILEGVCISGGEPTLQPDLEDFILKIRSYGLQIKLDTNGSRPDILRSLCEKKLLDYVAMDVKAAPSAYMRLCGLVERSAAASPDLGLKINASPQELAFFRPYLESVDFLMSSGIDYEFRTTLVKGFHTQKDMYELATYLTNAKAWYLQSYEESSDVIFLLENGKSPAASSDFCTAPGSFSPQELQEYLAIAREFVPSAALRGVS